MGGKIGIVEGLERISRDWAKNFTKSWTLEELAESVDKFNQIKDLDSRCDLFCRFLNARHIHYINIETLGIFQTDFISKRLHPGYFMPRDTREMKVDITELGLVILKKEMVRWGCQHTTPYPTWIKKRKISFLEIKEVQIKERTLLVTLG